MDTIWQAVDVKRANIWYLAVLIVQLLLKILDIHCTVQLSLTISNNIWCVWNVALEGTFNKQQKFNQCSVKIAYLNFKDVQIATKVVPHVSVVTKHICLLVQE